MTVPLVIFTAFDAQEAEALAKRIENAPPRFEVPPPQPPTPTNSLPPVIFTAFDADKAEELRERIKNKPQSKDKPTQKETAVSIPQILSEPRLPDIIPDSEEPDNTASDLEFAWSSKQPYLNMNAADMSYYTTAQHDEFVREVAISLQHEKLILAFLEEPVEYLKRFARYNWDEEADEAAAEFIQWYVQRFRSELERQRDITWSEVVESDIEYWIRDVANDERESVIVYDLEAGATLFVRPGVKDSVTLQKLHQKLTEGRNIVVIHNHPNNTGATLADFDAAAWLDAEYLIVVNPDGALHRYARDGDDMVALAPLRNPDYVAPANPLETAAADLAYILQNLREFGDPPAMVMRQGEAAPKVLDYVNHAQSGRSDRPHFDQGYAQYDPPDLLSSTSSLVAMQMLAGALGDPNLAFGIYAGAGPRQKGMSALAYSAATWTELFGWDSAPKLLKHPLELSGQRYEIPVNRILADVPGFRQSIMDYVGFELAEIFAPSNAEGGGSDDLVIEQIGDHTVYGFPLDWREVGIGAEDDIFGFDGEIPLYGIPKLLIGEPIPEDATQEEYDWYLALGKFYYYPRVTVVVDNNTGDAEVGLVIEVRDQYDWHADAGFLDRKMADLEEAGLGRNFPVTGQSAPIIGSFNLNDRTTKSDAAYYHLKIEAWNDDV